MNEIYDKLIDIIRSGRPCALAVVTTVSGTVNPAPGASAVFTPEGLLAGTLGGGALEAESEKRAREAMVHRDVRLLALDLKRRDDSDREAGEARVTVLIDGRPGDDLAAFEDLKDAVGSRRYGVLSGRVLSGNPLRMNWRWVEKERISEDSPEIEIKTALRTDNPAWGRYPGGWMLALPVSPRCRLVIAGAGHVGRALTHLGGWLNFDVTVIDDRPEFTGRDRLPDANRIILDDIPDSLRKFPFDPDTFVVIALRDPARDAEALRACIGREGAYLGLMGSARKGDRLRRLFLEKGWATARDWEKIHAPIGIDIGSQTAHEIAISIACQLVQVRADRRRNSSRVVSD